MTLTPRQPASDAQPLSPIGHKLRLQLLKVAGAAALAAVWAPAALADFYHYEDILIGDHAMGLGGAFTAVADDASAIHYNPAGLARIKSVEISGSVTALYASRSKIEGLFDTDYHRQSTAIVPVFLGGAYQLDGALEGWSGGFGIYTPVQSSVARDEVIDNDAKNNIRHMHQVIKTEGTTTHIAAALAHDLTARSQVGFGITGVRASRLYMHGLTARFGPFTGGEKPAYYSYSYTSSAQLDVTAVAPSLGILVAPVPDLSLGFSVRSPVIVSQSAKLTTDTSGILVYEDETPVGNALSRDESTESSDKPLTAWPADLRAGLAWRLARDWRLSFDASHHTSDGGTKFPSLRRRAVTNAALGLDVRSSAAIQHAFGLFSNADAHPEVTPQSPLRSEHVDFLGVSYALAFTRGKSRYTLGALMQQGVGKAQYNNDPSVNEVQTIKTQSFGLAGSIAHRE